MRHDGSFNLKPVECSLPRLCPRRRERAQLFYNIKIHMSLDNDVLMGLILPAAFSLASLVTHQATSQLQLQIGWWLVSSRVDASKQPPQPRVAARRRTNQPTNSKIHIRCCLPLAFTIQQPNPTL